MKIRLFFGVFLLALYDSPKIVTFFGVNDIPLVSWQDISDNMNNDIPLVSWQDISDNMNYVQGKDQPRWYVINVLSRGICMDCSIPGSINIPTHLLNRKLKKWPRSRKIIIYCAGADCPLSKYAFQVIQSMGFSDVSVLDGGMRTWRQKMLPTLGRCKYGYLHG